jgi:hypothetical protein
MAINPYREWQKSIKINLPDWAARVFALRDQNYVGRGGHYELEHNLGKVICIANKVYLDTSHCEVIDEVIVEGFVEDLEKAEKSIS